MEFKTGDKIRILGGTEQNGLVPKMRKYCGQEGKIELIGGYPKYRVCFEDGCRWDFNKEDLEKIGEDLEKEVEDLRELIKPCYRDWETDRKSTRLNSSHSGESRMPSSA